MAYSRSGLGGKQERFSMVSCATDDSAASSSVATPLDASPSTQPSAFPIITIIANDTFSPVRPLSPIARSPQPRRATPHGRSPEARASQCETRHSRSRSPSLNQPRQTSTLRPSTTFRFLSQRPRSLFPQTISRLKKAFSSSSLSRVAAGSRQDTRCDKANHSSSNLQDAKPTATRPKETQDKRHWFNKTRVKPG